MILRRFFPLLLTLSLVSVPQTVMGQSVEQLIQQGNTAMGSGKYPEAEELFRRAITNDKKNATAYTSLCDLFYRQNKLHEAEAVCRQAIALNSDDAYAYFLLGLVLSRQNKLDEAIANYEQAIKLNPKDPYYIYSNRGDAFKAQRNLDKAIADYTQAIQLNPTFAYIYNNRGDAFKDQGNLDKAIADYTQAIQLNPTFAYIYNNRGDAFKDQGNLDKAIADYTQAIQLNPTFAYIYNNRGDAFKDQEKLDEAIADYTQAIQLNPKDAYSYNSRGNAFKAQEKLDEAIADYTQAIQLKPKEAQGFAHNSLGLIFQEQGHVEKAIEEFKQAINLNPNLEFAKNNLGEAERLLALRDNPLSGVFDDSKNVPSEVDEPLVKVLRSTVRIIAQLPNGSSIGAGWVVKREGDTVWIVTNRHVISDNRVSKRLSDTIQVEFFSELKDRHRHKATPEYTTDPPKEDSDLDLAVLKVTGIPLPPDIQPLKLNPGKVKRNTPVFIIGHPGNLDKPWSSVTGEVINYDTAMLPINALLAQGNSGGPVIDQQKKEVIGVMVRIRTDKDIPLSTSESSPDMSDVPSATRGVGLAYPIHVVIKKLREWHILP